MPDVSVLDVRLYDEPIGTLTHLQGDRTIFAFNEDYVANPGRPTLSLSFKDNLGGLITNIRPTQRVVPPFFSNLLPEGGLRRYLAERAGVSQQREFFLLWVLGLDLPGALSIHPVAGEALPPGDGNDLPENAKLNALRFSLAGVQLKFSAFENAGKGGGLTIPAEGVGGSWIVKLPSQQFTGVPENEFSMMTVADMIGMEVPLIKLVDLDAITGIPEGIGELKGQALAVSRFDRTSSGPVHIEDFAQVFGVFPDDKYKRASYANIARVIGIEAGGVGAIEFIRRLVFSVLIGNGDMHLKNWSLIYPGDGDTPALAPIYDMLSTVPYIPADGLALSLGGERAFKGLAPARWKTFANRARLPEPAVLKAVVETVKRIDAKWWTLPEREVVPPLVLERIDAHVKTMIPILTG